VVRLQQLEENYRQRASAVQSKVPALIVSYIMEELIVTVREIEMYAKCTYHTARTAFNTLSGPRYQRALRIGISPEVVGTGTHR
jgi:hypothetical protein